MSEFVVDNTELGGGKLKRGNRFLKPNFELHPKLDERGVRYDMDLLCEYIATHNLSSH
ncbi:MAG: hypothetical protein V7696_19775 [Halioglobus sp.]